MKAIKGWKTVGFNTLAGLPAILMVVGQIADLQPVKDLIPEHYLPIYLAVVTIANLILRNYTTTPIGKKL